MMCVFEWSRLSKHVEEASRPVSYSVHLACISFQVESLKAETDRSFIKSLQKVRSEMESKHKDEMNEQKMSIMKECLQMAPHELESRIGNMLHDMQAKNQVSLMLLVQGSLAFLLSGCCIIICC